MMKSKLTDEEFFSCKLPGATRVLTTVFGEHDFSNIPKRVLDAATMRGKEVHKSIENYINSGCVDKPKIDFEYQIYIDYFNDWCDKYQPEFIVSELKLISKKLGFKGIIDTIFIEHYEEDSLVMCDWKTSSSLDVFIALCQLNLYLILLEDNYEEYVNKIKKLKILSLTKSSYKYYEFDVNKELAYSILNIYKEKQKLEL